MFFYFSVIEATYENSWSNIAQRFDIDLRVMKSRSAWPIFHGPVTLPYSLNIIWCMNIIVQDYESVQSDVWPQNKCRSLWHISWSTDFALYLEDCLMYEHHTLGYESLWPNIWPQNKCRSLWPIFHGPLILPYILMAVWCMNIIIWDYESVWPDIWPKN